MGEPHSLQVYRQCLKVWRGAVALAMLVDGLQRFADGEIVFSLLAESDIPASQRSLGQAIDICFLPQRQVFKPF